jgi:hypothetical protein
MTLQEHCHKDKSTIIAMHALVQECAAETGLSLAGNLSEVCQQAEVNRTQIYEKKAQLRQLLAGAEVPGPGRPAKAAAQPDEACAGCALREQVLRYRLAHPGAMVHHPGGSTSYSDGFRRFILDLADEWVGDLERFCAQVEVPYRTLISWQKRDRREPYGPPFSPRPMPALGRSVSAEVRQIVEDYACWEGSLRDFLGYEAARLKLAPTAIRRVLVITGLLAVKARKSPRYRGSTVTTQPGEVLVTDGKAVAVVSTASGVVSHYNWQAMVDQPTACHTASVVTDTECAQGVRQAFEDSCQFLGRCPQVLVHDNKPIHHEEGLKAAIEPTTKMLPATPARPENKAVVEGEFGKFEQAVGSLHLDDSRLANLKRSAVSEVIRAYSAGINHAGRAEFDGKSRLQVLREACPDPKKDRVFLEQLRSAHAQPRRQDSLPSQPVARTLLDQGFVRFGLEARDPKGELRTWLSARYTPEAIRQGLAIFGTEQAKGRLRNRMAHRYLVKLIQSCQEELNLRNQESLLREFAETERRAWLAEMEQDYALLQSDCEHRATLENDLAFCLSEQAVFGSLPLQRAFWEEKLKGLLSTQRQRIGAVCRHIRRLFEAAWNDRFQLISRLVAWEKQLA